MKRFMFIGAIFASMVVLALLSSKEGFTETKIRSEKVIITVDVRSGRVDSVKDENGHSGEPLTQATINRIQDQSGGFRHIGMILYHQLSPGCVDYCTGGYCITFCY